MMLRQAGQHVELLLRGKGALCYDVFMVVNLTPQEPAQLGRRFALV